MWFPEQSTLLEFGAGNMFPLFQFLLCGMCGVLCARKRTGLIVSTDTGSSGFVIK